MNSNDMPETPDPRPSFLLDDPRIDEAMHKAAKRAIAWHHFEGRSVPIMKNGQIVWFNPDGTVTDDCQDHAPDYD